MHIHIATKMILITKRLCLFASALALSACLTPGSIKEVYQQAENLESSNSVFFYELPVSIDNLGLSHLSIVSPQENLFSKDESANEKKAIIFIHGTPGDWKIFAHQLADKILQQEATLIALERPGWGGSQLKDGGVMTRLDEEAKILAEGLRQLSNKAGFTSITLVGHSYGATLLPLILTNIDAANVSVTSAHLWAGNLSSQHQKTRWYNKAADTWAVQLFLGPEMEKSNEEMLALNKELVALDDAWKKITTPLMFVQGKKDKLVDPGNIVFAESIHTAGTTKVVALENTGHLFLLSDKEKTRELLLSDF